MTSSYEQQFNQEQLRRLQSDQQFQLDDKATQLNNSLSDPNLFKQLAPFSKKLGELGEGLLTKHIEDQNAQALYDYRRSAEKMENPMGGLDDDLTEQSRVSEGIAQETEKESPLLAEEFRSNDPYYTAALNRLRIQDRASQAGFALEAEKDSLVIEGADGQPLRYVDINNASDMAAWTAAFEAKFIKENFGNVTKEAFAAYVDKPLQEALQAHSNRWATENVRKRKEERTAIAQRDLSLSAGEGNLTTTAMNMIRSRRLSRQQIASTFLTMAQGGQLHGNQLLEMQQEFDLVGGGKSSLAKELGANFGILQQAVINREQQVYNNERNEIIRADFQLGQDLRASLADDPDGSFTLSQLDEYDRKFFNEYGTKSTQVANLREYAADKVAYDAKIDEIKTRIQQGEEIPPSELRTLPIEVLNQLSPILNSPLYKQGVEANKLFVKALFDAAKTNVKESPAGTSDPSVTLMGMELERQFRLKIKDGATPQQAYDEVIGKFYKQIEADQKRNLDERQFLDADGYIPMRPKADATLNAQTQRVARFNKLRDMSSGMSIKNILQSPGAIYNDKQFMSKVQMIRSGDVQFDGYDRYAARMLGMSPFEMIKAIAENNPNYDGPVIELPPIMQIVQEFTPEQKAIMNNIQGTKPFVRALSMTPGAVPVLPARLNTSPQESEMMDYMTGTIGMSQIHAMGLLVNMIRESSLMTTNPGDGGTSDGLFQWHAGRLTKAREALGGNWDNWKAQISYALQESGEPGQEYLQQQFSSPQEAADWWMLKWERPADTAHSTQRHREILQQLR